MHGSGKQICGLHAIIRNGLLQNAESLTIFEDLCFKDKDLSSEDKDKDLQIGP